MTNPKNIKFITAMILIITFLFYSDVFLYPQTQFNFQEDFQKARNAYAEGQYSTARTILEKLIERGLSNNAGSRDMIGSCHLLLGAVLEKQNIPILAGEHYRKARDTYGILAIYGLDLKNLPIYRQEIIGTSKIESYSTPNVIPKATERSAKKFPVYWVVGGVIAITILAVLLAKKKEYTLTVTKGTGVDGTPDNGSAVYKKGAKVTYDYRAQYGYGNLIVQLDGQTIPASGTITMDTSHTLTANASIAPIVKISSHTSGETVTGRIYIEGTVQCTKRISRIEFLIDNVLTETDIDGDNAFSFLWVTRKYEDGPYTVTIVAYDSDSIAGSAQINLTVIN